MSQNNKLTKKKKIQLIVTSSLAVLIVLTAALMAAILFRTGRRSTYSPVHHLLTFEAGSEPDVSAFLKDDSLKALLDENSTYDMSKVGDYRLTLHLSNGREEEVTLRVVDTVAPKMNETLPILVKKDSVLRADTLIANGAIEDATAVRVSFLTARADTSEEGLSSVAVRIEDEGGNVTKAEVSYYVTGALADGYYYEIGTAAPLADELLPGSGAVFQTGERLTSPLPAVMNVRVGVFGGAYLLRYEAKDTIPPVGEAATGMRFRTGTTLPEDASLLLKTKEDATPLVAAYKENYILDKPELRTIVVVLTDAGGNVTEVPVVITVYEDDEGDDKTPPVISGVKDLVTVPGVAPDYLDGVTVFDNRDGEIPVSRIVVDSSRVNLNVISTDEGYPVTYTVFDAAGNRGTATARVRVQRTTLTEEEMNEMFDTVMSSLKTQGLSRFTVLSRVYDLLTGSYALTGVAPNAAGEDYTVEAYWGFKLKRGNYNTYVAMTRVILDRLNIEYMVVDRAGQKTTPHSWLLVDYGIGWLYMDCAPIDGYVWSKSGELYPADSPEAKALSSVDIKKREAMTDVDLAELTDLMNGFVPDKNYYTVNTNGKTVPKTAVREEGGGYTAVKYKVTYTALSGGSLTGNTNQTVVHGGYSSAVTAVPRTGYRFVRWSDGVTSAQRSDLVKNDISVNAVFELDNGTISFYDITYTVEGHGKIRGSTVQHLLFGKTTSAVTAVPEEGYYFISWSDGNTSPARSDVVKGDAVYTASFGKLIRLTYTAGSHGSITGQAVQQIVPGASGEPVAATPEPGYLFAGWSDGVSTAVRQDRTMENFTVSAVFVVDTNSYTIVYRAGAGGTVTGTLSQTAVAGTRGSSVEAVPDPGYVFVSWSDGLTDARRNDRIYENQTLTAVFRRLGTCTLTYTASEGGSITGEATQSVTEGQSGSSVTATANDGWRFVSWSDGLTAPTRTDTPSENMTVTALFEEEPSEITPSETPEAPGEGEEGA